MFKQVSKICFHIEPNLLALMNKMAKNENCSVEDFIVQSIKSRIIDPKEAYEEIADENLRDCKSWLRISALEE